MPGVVSRPTFGPQEKRGLRPWETASVGGTTARLVGLRAGGGSLLLGALIALAVFAAATETRAQGGKAPAPGSGPTAKAKAATAEETYGDQGGEKVAPANARLPNAVMR